ncbi:hypothetical protein AGIG_G3894 [Arapaima gigas]
MDKDKHQISKEEAVKNEGWMDTQLSHREENRNGVGEDEQTRERIQEVHDVHQAQKFQQVWCQRQPDPCG